MPDVKQVFDAAADGYDALRRRLIPCFDGFYGTAADLVAAHLPPDRPSRVLDLGAGTGLLSAEILRRVPAATATLLDFSGEMLARARARFDAAAPGRVAIRAGDYVRAPLEGPWDAIVSALSIHHLPDPEKRAVYARALAALRPGGLLVNADNVLAEDPAAAARDRALWIAAVRATGIAPADLDAALERTKVDVLAPLALQLGWLRELGFTAVDCVFKWHHFAVLAGVRPAASGPPAAR
ncbi:class I SAM-dependent methyltransferase [Anaeromyxobacter oryzae]|uniref:Methyltransferase n=1 Tax=Anaeromyxobacter oryzae TaxID=2918170 RepID=A0ABM7X113_9BACT|nr:class I SAM-dependent methyltransferase [Anaeromyxobacter oryzae]BDG05417.1 methyltransferase [Anaeromyxobacter oryzae]